MSSGHLPALALLDLDERWELEASELSLPLRVANEVRSLSPVQPTLLRALFAAADFVEQDGKDREQAGGELEYHNRTHVHDVLRSLSLLQSTREADFVAAERLILMIAMIVHDLGHNGRGNSHKYELESRSWRLIAPTLREAGLSAAEMGQVRAIILTTDPQGYAKLPTKKATKLWHSIALAVDADLFASVLPRYGFRAGWRLRCEMESVGLSGPDVDKLATLNGRSAFLRHVPVLSDSAQALGLPALIASQLAAIEALSPAHRQQPWSVDLETEYVLAVRHQILTITN